MNPDLDTLATALYATIDDLLIDNPHWAPPRPRIGIAPKLADAELVTLAVIQALLGFGSEAHFIRYAQAHLLPWFPYIPGRAGYNKRLRRSRELLEQVMSHLARACPSWWDDLWLVDSTPIECGRSRQTQQRSDLAGWASYGYSPSHSRILLGPPPPSHRNPLGPSHSLRPDPGRRRRTRHLHRHDRTQPTYPPRPDPHRGQRLPTGRVRTTPPTQRHHPHPARPQNRTTPTPPTIPQTLPPNHRINHPHPQNPTRTRTPRRTHQTRCHHTRHPKTPRPNRRHLAQRNHPTTRPRTLPHPIRPLKPWN